jgi:hypothetical protein
MEPIPPAQPETELLTRARRELEALAAATRALGAASDVGPALGRIAAAARELSGADLAYVTGQDPGSGLPRVLAVAPGPEDPGGPGAGPVSPTRWPGK